MTDYKFFCFGGEVKALFIATDRNKKDEEVKFNFFDADFNHLPFTNGHPNASVPPERPDGFEEMKQLAAKISKGIPQARIDLYNINGEIKFGEITFFHHSGLMPFVPEEWDKTFGAWIKLPQSKSSGNENNTCNQRAYLGRKRESPVVAGQCAEQKRV